MQEERMRKETDEQERRMAEEEAFARANMERKYREIEML